MTKKMNFIEAVQYLQESEGKSIETCKKVRWVGHPDNVFIAKYDSRISLCTYMRSGGGLTIRAFVPSSEEILGEWEVYND